ncbi:MAG: SDR family oxidoreductase [Actinomycetota bacterium]|nr:SDR family oxidoreductase [Actinomycetota bacterium]
MRVLVAGGAGLIGSAMCARLLDRGDSVLCVDNYVTGRAANLDGLLGRRAMTFIEADVCRDIALPPGAGLDAVINLACPASPVDFDRLGLEIMEAGSRGVANLLDVARSHGARFLQASTSEVYGDPESHPQAETYWGNVNPVGPRSVYDEAKRFGEALTMAHHRRFGTEVRIARIFNTYGPRMRLDDGRVVSNFVVQALQGRPITIYGDGSQTRSFCYVDDEVGGLIALLESDFTGPVNVGDDRERTVRDMAETVLELTGSESEIVYVDLPVDDPTRRRPDLTLARRVLGWQPSTSLEDGLKLTIGWFRAQLPA